MGYECVELIEGFCEVGHNCLTKCNHSFQAGTEKEKQATAAFERLANREMELLKKK